MQKGAKMPQVGKIDLIMLPPTAHTEFVDIRHFRQYYRRQKAEGSLNRFVDFFWETKFDGLWNTHPEGFADLLFPDIAYTYLINHGDPFHLRLDKDIFEIRSDSFLPRNKAITAYHQKGSKIFGIKFKVSPVLLQKEIDFFEYRDFIFPLVYLIDQQIVSKLKEAAGFDERVGIAQEYYGALLQNHKHHEKVAIVTDVLQSFYSQGAVPGTTIQVASHHRICTRTLQRYFQTITGLRCKEAHSLIRIRKALSDYIDSPESFCCQSYGYYDSSHFFKAVRKFLRHHPGSKVALPMRPRSMPVLLLKTIHDEAQVVGDGRFVLQEQMFDELPSR